MTPDHEREPFLVRAVPKECRVEARGKRFRFGTSPNRLGAARLLLRLMIGTEAYPGERGPGCSPPPRLWHDTVRIEWGDGAYVEALGVPLPMQRGGDAPRSHERYANGIRTELRRILKEELDGLDFLFPAALSEKHDVLCLDAVEPDVDLVGLAADAAAELQDREGTSPGAYERLTTIETRTRSLFEDLPSLTVHPHLTPFAHELQDMHLELLRLIVGRAATRPDAASRRAASDAGPRLANYGERAFRGNTSLQFLTTSEDRLGGLDERWRLLCMVFGGEDRVPDVAQEEWSRATLERRPARAGRLTTAAGFGARDLETGRILRVDEVAVAKLRIHQADERYVARGSVCPFVPRSAGIELARRIDDALARRDLTVIVVSGEPTAGKTRLAFEVLRQRCPHAWFIAPRVGGQLERVVDPASHAELSAPATPVVLWLDDVERFVSGTDELTAVHLETVSRHWGGTMLIVCLRGGRGVERVESGQADAEELLRIVGLAREPELDVRLELDDDELGQAASILDGPLLEAARRQGLGPALAARPLLIERYRHGGVGAAALYRKDGQALVDALLGWTAVVGEQAIPNELARQAWERARPGRGQHGRPGEDKWEGATDWATHAVAPGAALATYDVIAQGFRVDRTVDPLSSEARAEFARQRYGELLDLWPRPEEVKR